jgi:hypothetical protein
VKIIQSHLSSNCRSHPKANSLAVMAIKLVTVENFSVHFCMPTHFKISMADALFVTKLYTLHQLTEEEPSLIFAKSFFLYQQSKQFSWYKVKEHIS